MRVVRGDTDGAGLRIGIVVARFNEGVTNALLDGAVQALAHAGVADDGAARGRVPGAFAPPPGARRLASSDTDAVVCLGAVIRGETAHFDLVANEAARGIADVMYNTGVPCTFEGLPTATTPPHQA